MPGEPSTSQQSYIKGDIHMISWFLALQKRGSWSVHSVKQATQATSATCVLTATTATTDIASHATATTTTTDLCPTCVMLSLVSRLLCVCVCVCVCTCVCVVCVCAYVSACWEVGRGAGGGRLCMHSLIPYQKFGFPYLGKSTKTTPAKKHQLMSIRVCVALVDWLIAFI